MIVQIPVLSTGGLMNADLRLNLERTQDYYHIPFVGRSPADFRIRRLRFAWVYLGSKGGEPDFPFFENRLEKKNGE